MQLATKRGKQSLRRLGYATEAHLSQGRASTQAIPNWLQTAVSYSLWLQKTGEQSKGIEYIDRCFLQLVGSQAMESIRDTTLL